MGKKQYSIIILIVLVVALFLLIIVEKKKQQNIQEKTGYNINLTTEHSAFFTVSNCANIFITSVNNMNSNKVLNLLNKNYILEHEIDNNNVFDKVSLDFNYDGEIVYKISKMYQKSYGKTTNRYYMYGSIYKQEITGDKFVTDYYLIINVDYKNMTYDVIPCSSTEYKELIHERK